MDFDIGNLLYVVITLVAIIVGLLGKKKKPANQEPGESGESGDEAQPGFMENLERMLRMGQDNPQVVDLQEYEEDMLVDEYGADAEKSAKPVMESASTPRSIMDDYDRIMAGSNRADSDAFLSDGDQLLEPLTVIDLDQEEGTNYFEVVKDFDAGTAVVYAAIINRLDY